MTISDSSRGEAVDRIEAFRRHVQSYIDLLAASGDHISFRVERNHALVQDERKALVAELAALERLIQKFGNNPRMNDGVWNVAYSPYTNAFSADTLARVQPSLDAVVDDLNVILGRLNAVSDREFVKATRKEVTAHSQLTWWHYSNPLWLGWSLSLWMWRHKLISGIATLILAPLIVAFLVHWLRWN